MTKIDSDNNMKSTIINMLKSPKYLKENMNIMRKNEIDTKKKLKRIYRTKKTKI